MKRQIILQKLKQRSPTILTCLGAVGVVATAVTAVKATPKAMELLEYEEAYKASTNEEMTKFEIVKTVAPAYIPSILIGVATIACIFGANVLNKKTQASLASAYALLDSSYKEYRQKVVEVFGEDADAKVKKAMAGDIPEDKTEMDMEGDEILFMDGFSLRYFAATMYDVLKAEQELNKMFASVGFVSLNTFYRLLDNPDLPPLEGGNGDTLGWYRSDITGFGINWIDFIHEKITVSQDGLKCVVISFKDDPYPNYL